MPSDPLFAVAGLRAVVTGACGAIGRAIVTELVSRGAKVIGVDADLTVVDVAAALGAAGVVLDVSDEDAVKRAFGEQISGADILVNNAGINIKQDPAAIDLATWRRIMDVNLTGYYLMARGTAAVQRALGRPGSIINVSSTASVLALGRGNLAYAVSKAGVNQLTRELAVEWAHLGIRVNAVAPSQVATPAWLTAAGRDEAGAVQYRRVLSGIPMGRLVEPEELVGPILFLASPAAAMVTGTVLPVDGGNLAFNSAGTLPNGAA